MKTRILLWLAIPSVGFAQQFNSDNYVTMPHGVMTIITTAGQQYATLFNSYALFPTWEFTTGVNLYYEDSKGNTASHYTVSLYAKHMVYENETKDGGLAFAAGSGLYPGYLQNGQSTESFHSYWGNAQLTLPLFNHQVSWDILPGFSVNLEAHNRDVWAMTYSTRVAISKIIPQTDIVVETFGAWGEGGAPPQYRAGLRWEASKSIYVAASYSGYFDGSRGAGFEIGVMLFTPPFLKKGGSDAE